MNKIMYVIFFCLIIVFFFIIKIFFINGKNYEIVDIKIDNTMIRSQLADNSAKRFKGLSGRESLEKDMGMLFIFDGYGKFPFVMRNMKFSIDIIWIRDNFVVDISKNLALPVLGAPLIEYAPLADINRVLEVGAGFTDSNNVKIGDTFQIIKPKT